jgi:hypothetical protein
MAIRVARKKARKVIQIAIVLNFLYQNYPMNPWDYSLTYLSSQKKQQ